MKVGLTGGIGSGKTTVAKIFAQLGVPVFIADSAAKMLMERSEKVKNEIIKTFGEKSYSNSGLDRKYLSSIVFNNEKKLELLNSIVHPAVGKHFENWKNQQTFPYVIYESAILFEKGGYKNCDYTILVTAPLEIRIDRVMKRDKITKKEVEARIAFQWNDEKKKSLADFIILNSDLSSLNLEVERIHKALLNSF